VLDEYPVKSHLCASEPFGWDSGRVLRAWSHFLLRRLRIKISLTTTTRGEFFVSILEAGTYGSVTMRDVERAARILGELRTLGVGLR